MIVALLCNTALIMFDFAILPSLEYQYFCIVALSHFLVWKLKISILPKFLAFLWHYKQISGQSFAHRLSCNFPNQTLCYYTYAPVELWMRMKSYNRIDHAIVTRNLPSISFAFAYRQISPSLVSPKCIHVRLYISYFGHISQKFPQPVTFV